MDVISAVPSLTSDEFQTLVDVLSDVDASVNGRWTVVGSISYRLFVPTVRTEPGLRDIDLLTYPVEGQNPDLLVSPKIREFFYVMHIGQPGEGYYYRLTHKASGVGVDIFTDVQQAHRRVNLGGLEVEVAIAERTLCHGLMHLLMLKSEGLRIEKKKPYNAHKLWQLLDQDEVLSFMDHHRSDYQRFLPDELQDSDSDEIVQHVLAIKPQAPYRQCDVKKQPVETVHGIRVEDEVTLRRLAQVEKPTTQTQRLMHKLYRLKMAVGL